ncbi:hypothetical protein [Acetobacter oeni]|uniref:KfrA N-terminal DNA-binding domain-containing protein n=1 Tax=Acetobacter oeni TaxID=304077 RepID=A0A511XPD2_9PROT|nr:hypothetical protein [Acetobacter oeni]MBB3884603.1 chromosome segregation ATPase [Acetobacter oeni]NHO20543.1 hypothetical protein [Acetobacter oeni]GBR07488.1 hypothetical protein AA21952_2355 [Acetobacter oeni LMG 21952]GEN64813.1 hypothetical protein AOE01nite_30370 [Acetobacter oeni]
MFGGNGTNGATGFILGRMSRDYSDSLGRAIQRTLYGTPPSLADQVQEQAGLIARLRTLLSRANTRAEELDRKVGEWQEYADFQKTKISAAETRASRAEALETQLRAELQAASDRESRLARALAQVEDNYQRLSADHRILATKADIMERRIWGYLSMEARLRKLEE